MGLLWRDSDMLVVERRPPLRAQPPERFFICTRQAAADSDRHDPMASSQLFSLRKYRRFNACDEGLSNFFNNRKA